MTRALFKMKNTTAADIEQILQEESIIDFPKTSLESFLDFDQKLKSDIELVKKLVCITY